MTRIALGHHVRGFKDRTSDFRNRKRFVEGLFSRDNRRVGCKHEMDPGVGNQVGLQNNIEFKKKSKSKINNWSEILSCIASTFSPLSRQRYRIETYLEFGYINV